MKGHDYEVKASFTAEMYVALGHVAEVEDCSMSEIIRRAFRCYLDHRIAVAEAEDRARAGHVSASSRGDDNSNGWGK